MSISMASEPDPKVREHLGDLLAIQKASLRWYWRLLAGIVALATVTSATFQVLSYFGC